MLVGSFYDNLAQELQGLLDYFSGNWVGTVFNHETWDDRILNRGIYYSEESLIEKYNQMFRDINPSSHQSIKQAITDISFAREQRGEFYSDGSEWEFCDATHCLIEPEQAFKMHRAYRLKMYTVDALITEAMIEAKVCALTNDKKAELLGDYLFSFLDETIVGKKLNFNCHPTPGASEKILAYIFRKSYTDFLENFALNIPVGGSGFRVFSFGKREHLNIRRELPELVAKFPIKFSLGPNSRLLGSDRKMKIDFSSWENIRNKLGLRLVDIAEKMGIEVEDVLLIEGGEEMPTAQQLEAYLGLVHSNIEET